MATRTPIAASPSPSPATKQRGHQPGLSEAVAPGQPFGEAPLDYRRPYRLIRPAPPHVDAEINKRADPSERRWWAVGLALTVFVAVWLGGHFVLAGLRGMFS